ncbi:MAG: Exodeoxyribonuclease 7 large subunit [Syntrophomonadaceae bacterium]|nr:Exodeoxyribonuclease 7 large subunit [Bacillota bacterium]
MTDDSSRILTVGQLTQYLKELFTADPQLSRLRVSGEISNFKRHTSGHLYFTLKDALASLRCVMFRSQSTRLNFRPADGMQVVAAGRVSVYERDGQYQLYVESLAPEGVGSLYAAFAELKQRLQAEGLFAAEHKKKLPRFPRRLGLVTSLTGAVVRDFLTTVGRRYPQAEVLIVPVLVQGPEAPGQIVAGIQLLNRTPGIDAIVLARGGGAIEELWAFNEESVARAIHASDLPVVSAVGHETDFTIADFVADVRAATPTAAAELAVPDQREIQAFLLSARQRMAAALQRNLEQDRRYLERLASGAALTRPLDRLEQQKQSLDNVQTRLESRIYFLLQKFRSSLEAIEAKLTALNPNQVLERGYALCLDRTGQVVRDAAGLAPGDSLEILLQRGRAEVVVEKAYEGGSRDGSTKPLV